jgi:Ca2+-binding EF-hand superfamily protein
MKRISLAVALLVTLALGCSASQPGPGAPAGDDGQTQSMGTGLQSQHGKGGMFLEADKDNDGKVTLAEANAIAASKFAAADTNKDGYLDAAEKAAARVGIGPRRQGAGPGPKGAGPARFDKNGDGKVSKDEAPARMKEHFDAIDTNKDGSLDQQELQAARAKHGAKSVADRVAHLDKNKDGKLSKDEVPERMQKHFDAVDTNKDGFVDAQELEAAHQKRMQQGGKGPDGKAGPDTDGDGKVSQAEFVARAQNWFKRMDANNDGAITRDELQARRGRGRGH